ncbi:unnamed protein product [Nezara viridula]|uniref:Carboxylesterase type B domain-containing protein n=1 Tax=Nezara viridula TaxID=85310 RepID=A0A9P0HP54_NEZVI|nr:unnamed protein product [Nezara viridula]
MIVHSLRTWTSTPEQSPVTKRKMADNKGIKHIRGRYRNRFTALPTGFQLPGILGGWRPDLQGKQRPDSPRQDTDRDVHVRTPYGEVQGFRVYLYDDPFPERGYRPISTVVERVRGNVSVFLGIPYALPPVKEGRFKSIISLWGPAKALLATSLK